MNSTPSDASTAVTVILFTATYLGMALGRFPGLALDRTGIALLAAVLLLVTGVRAPAQALQAIDFPTLCVLFGLMALSAQFVLAGFYDWCADRIASLPRSQHYLLGATVLLSGLLSALLANDVVTFAIAPVLAGGLLRRGVDPKPHLIALAAASNAGSAATVIGNPQNILIGEAGHLHFANFFAACALPAAAALVTVYAVIAWVYRATLAARPAPPDFAHPAVDAFQVAKGAAATVLVVALFLSPLPRSVGALGVAALLLVSRRFATRDIMAQVDWHLLLLFASLFVINDAFRATGIATGAMAWIEHHGMLPDHLSVLTPLTVAASNTVGNVPAVILLLSLWKASGPGALYGLALLSTLAGNLLLTGSIANLIVCERAAAAGVRITFLEHARCGIPLTLISLAFAVAWLLIAAQMPW